MAPGPRLTSSLSRLRAVLTDSSDVEREPLGDRWDIWRRGVILADGHPLIADTTTAILVAMISALWLVHHPRYGPAIWVIQAALIVPLAWRRRYPVAVFVIISLVALVQWAVGAELVADLALLVSLYSVASHRPRAVATVAAIVVEVGAIMASLRWSLAGSWLRSLVFLSGLAAAAFLLGTNLRSRRSRLAALTERAERLERERDQQTLIVAAAERTRIAREMHDIIAHSLAVIISLADGATAKLHAEPERSGAAIRNVSDIGRQALADTRRLLGVLRADGADGLAPQPGVAQIEGLLEKVRTTGLGASLTIEGHRRPLTPSTELTAYRIVQEATTNALKHAIGATTLAVTLDYGRDVLGISVSDDGRSPRALVAGREGTPPGGHGLAGMRERAAVYNGSVAAGPGADGWLVRARLHIAPESGGAVARPPATATTGPASTGTAHTEAGEVEARGAGARDAREAAARGTGDAEAGVAEAAVAEAGVAPTLVARTRVARTGAAKTGHARSGAAVVAPGPAR